MKVKTEEKVKRVLKKTSGAERLSATSSLKADLGLDSMQLVELLVTLEDEFKISLKEADMNPEKLKNVGSVIRLVNRYVKKGD